MMNPDDSDYDDNDVPETGAVFSFGNGLPDKFWIGGNKVVIQVACGEEHSCILSNVGKAYTFGKNSWGQLGNGTVKSSDKPTFVKSLKEEYVTHIACGRNHTLFYTQSNKLFGCGCNSETQVGVDLGETILTPLAHNRWPPQSITFLSAGGDYSAVVNNKGELFTWGSNDTGQLGIGANFDNCGVPTRISLPEPVVHVSCGHYHMAAVSQSGHLYMWGEEEGGKLSVSTAQMSQQQLSGGKSLGNVPLSIQSGIIFTPQRVTHFPKGVSYVACGLSHSMVITRDEQRVFVWGEGRAGQLGLGTRVMETTRPIPLERHGNSIMKAKAISAGESHSAIILTDGSLFTFGDIRHNKLGLGSTESMNQFLPKRVMRMTHLHCELVTCGGCHTLVIAKPRKETTALLNSTQEMGTFGLLTWPQMDQSEETLNSTLRQSLNASLQSNPDDDQIQRRSRVKMREKRRERSNSRRRPKDTAALPSLQNTQNPYVYQDLMNDGREEVVQVKAVKAARSAPTKDIPSAPPKAIDPITPERMKALDELATLMEADDPRGMTVLGPTMPPAPSGPHDEKQGNAKQIISTTQPDGQYSDETYDEEDNINKDTDHIMSHAPNKDSKLEVKQPMQVPQPPAPEVVDDSANFTSNPATDSQTALLKAPPKKTGCFKGMNKSKVDAEPMETPAKASLNQSAPPIKTEPSPVIETNPPPKKAGCFGGLCKSKVGTAPNETAPLSTPSPEIEPVSNAQPVKTVESAPPASLPSKDNSKDSSVKPSTEIEPVINAQPVKTVESAPPVPSPSKDNTEDNSVKPEPGCCDALFSTPKKSDQPRKKGKSIWETFFAKSDKTEETKPNVLSGPSESVKPVEPEHHDVPRGEEPKGISPTTTPSPQLGNPVVAKPEVIVTPPDHAIDQSNPKESSPSSVTTPSAPESGKPKRGFLQSLVSKQDPTKTPAPNAEKSLVDPSITGEQQQRQQDPTKTSAPNAGKPSVDPSITGEQQQRQQDPTKTSAPNAEKPLTDPSTAGNQQQRQKEPATKETQLANENTLPATAPESTNPGETKPQSRTCSVM